MRNRVITVPKNKDAQEDLNYDRANQLDLIEWRLTDEEFNKLYTLNVFEIINSTCQVLIDDFEDEEITDAISLQKVKTILDEMIFKDPFPELVQMKEITEYALNYRTGLFFFF